MAFTYTSEVSTFGNKKIATGTYTSAAGSTGGDIITGLDSIGYFNTDCEVSQAGTVTKATRANGTVTVLSVANEIGTWFAIGN